MPGLSTPPATPALTHLDVVRAMLPPRCRAYRCSHSGKGEPGLAAVVARADATFTIWFRDCSFAGVVAVEGDEWSWWPSSGFGSFASGTRADIASAIHLAISAAECDFLMGLRPNPPRYGAIITGTLVPQR